MPPDSGRRTRPVLDRHDDACAAALCRIAGASKARGCTDREGASGTAPSLPHVIDFAPPA
ncbi:hypothetical protein AB0N17_13935 [Streptomyces sp. NPDC051133]|uniref:hypothetical protein n=1 Tax=Streptomyces sp. NPDC051133 TaxID=3155521 RepID=UPI003425CB18